MVENPNRTWMKILGVPHHALGNHQESMDWWGKKIDIGKLRMFPGKSMVIGNYWEYKTMIYWEFIGNNCGYNNEAPLAVIMMILNHLIVANYWDAIMIFLWLMLF